MYSLYIADCIPRMQEILTIDFRSMCILYMAVIFVDVDCGLTSHSAIFQLYSDGTDVQFPNFDLLPGTHAMGS